MQQIRKLYFHGEPEGTIFYNMTTQELIKFLYDNRPRDEEIPSAVREALHRLELISFS